MRFGTNAIRQNGSGALVKRRGGPTSSMSSIMCSYELDSMDGVD